MPETPQVGILAVQGDFEAHARMLDRIGVAHRYVRRAEDLTGLDGLILPGGESTTHLKLLDEEGLLEPIREFAARGGAVFGTCAGAILLAREVRNPSQSSLGVADIVVTRNAYGRQLSSAVRFGKCSLTDKPMEMVFIRAPVIEEVGRDVRVVARCEERPVLVEQGRMLIATFHPELTDDPTVHRHFLSLMQNGAGA